MRYQDPPPQDVNGTPYYTDKASYDALVAKQKADLITFRADNVLKDQALTDFKVLVTDLQNDGHTVPYIAQELRIEIEELKKMLLDPNYQPFKE